MTKEKTMRKIILTAVALGAGCGFAEGADLPVRKVAPLPPPAPAIYKWTGFYGGLNLGAGIPERGGVGVIGGGQIGYNYQVSPLFVAGIETDFQGTTLGGGGGRGPRGGRGVDWFGSVRGRFGVTAFSPALLLYGTGGFAYGDVGNSVAPGWTAGGGVEWAFSPAWSAKVEYLYTDLRSGGAPPAPFSGGARFHTVRAGVNYHFNLLEGLPIKANF
jgi:outer membrane immunogenic protein